MRSSKLLKYLRTRNVSDNTYIDFCCNHLMEGEEFVLCSINEFDFVVDHFFDESNEIGLGLIPTNEILNTSTGKILSIGTIQGDDIICMDIETGKIKLWLIENGGGETIEVADTLASFLEAVTNKNHV